MNNGSLLRQQAGKLRPLVAEQVNCSPPVFREWDWAQRAKAANRCLQGIGDFKDLPKSGLSAHLAFLNAQFRNRSFKMEFYS